MNSIKNLIVRTLASRGYKLTRTYEPDIEDSFSAIHEKVKEFTMTSAARQYGLFKAVEYVVKQNIEGDIVECGVWRGGSSMLAALALMLFGSKEKNIFLYDTFTGMSEPTENDVNLHGTISLEKWKSQQQGNINLWDYAPFEDVKNNMYSTDYPAEKIFFVQGKVEDTIPVTLPKKIAVLRLDTDWYESTKHELTHLFPLLSVGGVLIIDDYGHWKGARKAVDEYFKENNIKILLNRLDYTGRIGVKISA